MRVPSSARSAAITIVAYGYAAYASYLAFSPGSLPIGYRYLVLLVAGLLLLAAHGLRLIRRSQIQRLFKNRQTLESPPSEAVMAAWEILFGWLGVTCALVFLYYAAPAEQLEAWYPRLFLCLSVLFVAAFRRALIFLATVLPFVFTITLLALWQDIQAGVLMEAGVKAAFLLLDGALLWWAGRIATAGGIFSVSDFEMPVGAGRIGERLSGFIRTQSSHFPNNGYLLDLTCIRRAKDGAKRATGEVLHHFRKVVRGDMPGARYNGCSVPVEFDIPNNAPPTSASEDARITWTLRATADLSDSTFSATFEVPVEEVPPDAMRSERERIDGGLGANPPGPMPAGGLRDGAVIFKSGSDWNASAELLTASFFCMWCQLVWLATVEALDWPSMAMFAVGLLFLAGLLWPLGTRIVTELRGGILSANRKELWSSRVETIAAPLVEAVNVRPAGLRPGLIDAQRCYDVVVQTQAGRKFTAGTQFRERRGANAVATELEAMAHEQAQEAGAQMAYELQGI